MSIEIDYTLLNEQTLNSLITEFVLREGTDYGAEEVSLENKVACVLNQLAENKVRILYESESERCTIMPV